MPFNFSQAALLGLASVLAGAINAVAGGGTFLTFPSLLFVGLPSIAANATSTVAVWPGSLASVWGYRRVLLSQRRMIVVLGLASLVGGGLGALLLLRTSNATFDRLIPWLLLFATLVFAFGGPIRRRLGWRLVPAQEPGTAGAATPLAWRPLLQAAALQFVVGIYGGFYGAGAGILELAILDLLGLDNIHVANGLKVILSTAFNTLAVVIFIVAAKVFWPHALLMVVGAVLGGYSGAYLAQKVPPIWVRWFVIAVGVVLTAYFFWRQG